VRKFFKKHHVMHLSTGSAGELWSTPLFFVAHPEKMILYFVSSPETNHGSFLSLHSSVAFSVSRTTLNIASIQGVQGKGDCHPCKTDLGRKLFLKAFPMAAPWLFTQKDFIFYELEVTSLKATSNTMGFGHKFYWP
jgi:uncharacterized protein YhbP (UPF0306 family)